MSRFIAARLGTGVDRRAADDRSAIETRSRPAGARQFGRSRRHLRQPPARGDGSGPEHQGRVDQLHPLGGNAKGAGLARSAVAGRGHFATSGFPADHEGRRAALRAACRASDRRDAGDRRISTHLLADRDVVVFASGAEDVLRRLRPGRCRRSSTATPPIPPRSSALVVPLITRAAARGIAAQGKESVVRVSANATGSRSRPICESDDRAILPLGSTEQHARLSLSVDSILSESVAARCGRAARRAGLSGRRLWADALFRRLSRARSALRTETYVRLVRDILDGLRAQGFRRILIVNGHGGNQPAGRAGDRVDGRQSRAPP